MDLEETKTIIENKIEAGELTREVRSQIKSYVDQKQNMREGFKETFKPLIESQEAVKESIDKEQNAMIKQLQKNQKALTEGLEGNRLAITSGFDKMDEVKKWELSQLPALEAIEEPGKEPEEEAEEEAEEDIIEKIKKIKERIKKKSAIADKFLILMNKASEERNFEKSDDYFEKFLNQDDSIKDLEKEMNRLQESLDEDIEEELQEEVQEEVQEEGVSIKYGKEQIDKYLNNKGDIDILKSYKLKLQSYYRNASKEKFKKAYERGLEAARKLREDIRNVVKYKVDSDAGFLRAYPDKKGANPTSRRNIEKYNAVQIFNINMGKLKEYKETTGTGIIHFNNPHQLIDRLELLAGSIFAGNNGVKQEFSQIAHLLHQLKVITKKQLNDLLKKYILNK